MERDPNVTAEPRTDEERAMVNGRLRMKYPQMQKQKYLERVKKGVRAEIEAQKKRRQSTRAEARREDRVSSGLSQAGVSDEDIRRLLGRG